LGYLHGKLCTVSLSRAYWQTLHHLPRESPQATPAPHSGQAQQCPKLWGHPEGEFRQAGSLTMLIALCRSSACSGREGEPQGGSSGGAPASTSAAPAFETQVRLQGSLAFSQMV